MAGDLRIRGNFAFCLFFYENRDAVCFNSIKEVEGPRLCGLEYGEFAVFADVELGFAFEAGDVAVFDFDSVAYVDLVDLLVPKRQLYGAGFVLNNGVCDVVDFVFEF